MKNDGANEMPTDGVEDDESRDFDTYAAISLEI